MASDSTSEKRLNVTIYQLFTKVPNKVFEEAIQMGWLGSNQFSALFNIDEVEFMAIVSAMTETLGGWDVGDGLNGGWGVGNGLTGLPRFRIEARTISEGEINWRIVVS
jgi:hypothetical protein